MTKKKDPKRPDIMQCDVRQSLHVKLTPEECNQRASEASRLVVVVVQKKDEFADLKEDLGKEIKSLEAQVTGLAKVASSGREVQEVECTQHFDIKTRQTWFHYRGEDYERRPMSDNEYQKCTMRPLFNDGPDVPNRLDKPDIKVELKEPATVTPITEKKTEVGEVPKTAKLPDAIANASTKKKGKSVKAAPPLATSHADATAPNEEDERTAGGSTTEDIADVMREETSKKSKVDHVAE